MRTCSTGTTVKFIPSNCLPVLLLPLALLLRVSFTLLFHPFSHLGEILLAIRLTGTASCLHFYAGLLRDSGWRCGVYLPSLHNLRPCGYVLLGRSADWKNVCASYSLFQASWIAMMMKSNLYALFSGFVSSLVISSRLSLSMSPFELPSSPSLIPCGISASDAFGKL